MKYTWTILDSSDKYFSDERTYAKLEDAEEALKEGYQWVLNPQKLIIRTQVDSDHVEYRKYFYYPDNTVQVQEVIPLVSRRLYYKQANLFVVGVMVFFLIVLLLFYLFGVR